MREGKVPTSDEFHNYFRMNVVLAMYSNYPQVAVSSVAVCNRLDVVISLTLCRATQDAHHHMAGGGKIPPNSAL